MRRHFSGGRGATLLGLFALALASACGSSDTEEASSPLTSAGGAGGQGGASGGSGGSGAGASGAAGASGNGSNGAVGAGVTAIFALPDSLDSFGAGCSADGLYAQKAEACVNDFLDHPFPSDYRRDEQGKVRWKGFPNPKQMPLLTTYTDVGDKLLDGFSPQAAGYVRFTGSLDPQTLPADPPSAAQPTSSVQLIDIDDASPDKGQRRLITLYYRDQEGAYWAPHTLSFMPTFGYPLRPKTRYAFVVTNAVKAAGGAALGRSPNLDAVLGQKADGASPKAAALRDAWAPALKNLEAAGVKADSIAHLAVFTTNDPTAELYAVRDDVRKNFPAPAAKDWKTGAPGSGSGYSVYEGNYGPSPDYQEGNIPFNKPEDGGAFGFENGAPKVQRQFDLRFALAVPDPAACPMPEAGYPVVLYAHGTGGDYRSYLEDGTAAALAKECVASMGVDQIFHGTRPGAPQGPNAESEVQLLFFNFQNPAAARTNGRQSAIDEVQRARLFTETKITVPASVSKGGVEVKFDASKVMFFGHSQGGQNGPLYLAIDDSARGGVLSGSGSTISIALLEKTLPTPSVAAAVKSLFLALKPDEFEELNPLHPAISFAQSLVDTVDPIHYVGQIIQHPRQGYLPKSIYQTEGVRPDFTGDSYTPPHAIEVQAVATGLPLMNPIVHPVTEMSYGGPGPVTIDAAGLSGNLAGGMASGVLAQWVPPAGVDGHFVVFHTAAQQQAARFCRNLGDDPKGKVPAP